MFNTINGPSSEEYMVVQKERSFRLTRDVLGKPVIDKFGFKIGKVNDIAISGTFSEKSFPPVNGILIGKKFIPWSSIKKIGSHFTLQDSLRKNDICPIPKGQTFVVKTILDEQLMDGNGRYVGRVDDIRLVYNVEEHVMCAAGVYSGALGIMMRMGMDVYGNVIPWTCIEKIRNEKPTGIVLNFHKKTIPVSERFALYGVRKV
jgi:sporulation protein YlmC with PRC-barrel domain